MFKKLKLKKRKEKKGKLHRTAKAQRFITTIKNVTEGKKKKQQQQKFKRLIGFLSANKIDNYNRGGEKEKKIQKNLQNKSKHKNNTCFSWVTAVRVLSLTGSHSPPHLPRVPNAVLISGPAVGAAQILI